jgi:hypothetical protein
MRAMLATALSGGTAMADNQDRRLPRRNTSGELKRQLNDTQLATLHTLERFGWELKFIRRQPGQQPVVILHDPDTRKLAILKSDGDLDENPVFHRFRG